MTITNTHVGLNDLNIRQTLTAGQLVSHTNELCYVTLGHVMLLCRRSRGQRLR